MKLRAWMIRENVSENALAKRLRTHRRTLNRWITEETYPLPADIARIEVETGGAVEFADWLPAVSPVRRRRAK